MRRSLTGVSLFSPNSMLVPTAATAMPSVDAGGSGLS